MASTTMNAAAATTTPDPEVWVYPPVANFSSNSLQPDSNGPVQVFYGDWMIIQWDPPTQSPYIGSACQNATGAMVQWAVHEANTTGSPLNYQFPQKADSSTPIGTLYCHFWFYGTRAGNSVTFVYSFDQRLTATTYSASAAVASSTTLSFSTTQGQSSVAIAGTASITSTTSSISTTEGVPETAATASTTGSATTKTAVAAGGGGGGGGLSAGASAGVGLGVSLGVLILARIAGLLWRKRKRPSRASSPSQYGAVVYNDQEIPTNVELHGENIAELEEKRPTRNNQAHEMG